MQNLFIGRKKIIGTTLKVPHPELQDGVSEKEKTDSQSSVQMILLQENRDHCHQHQHQKRSVKEGTDSLHLLP